jgi:hypothetical protein
VKKVNSDGWFLTLDGELIDPSLCCPVTDWQEYNGGFALFEQDTGRILESRDIKEYLIEVGDWRSEVAIASHFGLAVQLVRTWLKNHQNFLLCREVRDGREWRLEECDSQMCANGTQNDNCSQKVEAGFSEVASEKVLPAVTIGRRSENNSQKVTNCDSVLSLENAETLQDFEQLTRSTTSTSFLVSCRILKANLLLTSIN